MIAVKLLSATRRNYFLVMRPDGSAAVNLKESAPMKIHSENTEVYKSWRSIGKPIKISDIKENFNAEQNKNIEKTLLTYPSFEKIVFFDGKGEAELISGDSVFGHTIYTPYGLEQKMRSSSRALPHGK